MKCLLFISRFGPDYSTGENPPAGGFFRNKPQPPTPLTLRVRAETPGNPAAQCSGISELGAAAGKNPFPVALSAIVFPRPLPGHSGSAWSRWKLPGFCAPQKRRCERRLFRAVKIRGILSPRKRWLQPLRLLTWQVVRTPRCPRSPPARAGYAGVRVAGRRSPAIAALRHSVIRRVRESAPPPALDWRGFFQSLTARQRKRFSARPSAFSGFGRMRSSFQHSRRIPIV